MGGGETTGKDCECLRQFPACEVRPKAVLKRLTRDKKTVDGRVHFILPREIGSVDVVTEVPERAVLQAVEELRYLSQA